MFLLDANVLIEAHRFYYPHDVAPGYWQWLETKHEDRHVASVKAVFDEIKDGKDALASWAHGMPATFWLAEDDAAVVAITAAVAWVTDGTRSYGRAAVEEFLDSADLRLLAAAHAHDHVIVTREVADPNRVKKVKIPDVAAALGVECVQPWDVNRDLGLLLVAPAAASG